MPISSNKTIKNSIPTASTYVISGVMLEMMTKSLIVTTFLRHAVLVHVRLLVYPVHVHVHCCMFMLMMFVFVSMFIFIFMRQLAINKKNPGNCHTASKDF